MARTRVRIRQTIDGDFVEENELLSDGTLSLVGPFNIVSVTAATKQIVVTSGEWDDEDVAPGDIIQIAGGTVNDGQYTVNTVIDNNTVQVIEVVVNAGAGGTAEAFYPPADEKIGIQDPGTIYEHTGVYNTLDDHLQDLEPHSRLFVMQFGRNSTTVTGGTYLRSAGNVSSAPGASPPRMPFNATIIAASISVDGAPGALWRMRIRVNGTNQAALTDALGTSDFIRDDALSVNVNQDDEINIRMANISATVNKPVALIMFRKRP